MREHRAFRQAGGAGSEDHERRVLEDRPLRRRLVRQPLKRGVPFEPGARLRPYLRYRAVWRRAVHGHDHAAGEPDAEVGGEIERLVGDAHMHRLVRCERRFGERGANGLRGVEEFGEAHAFHRLARGEAPGGVGKQCAEVLYSHSIVAGGLEEMS